MKKIITLLLAAAFTLCFAGCTVSQRNTTKATSEPVESAIYHIKDISIEVPKTWTYKSNLGNDYFYPEKDENMFYIMNEEMDIDEYGWTDFEEYTDSLKEADNFKEISKGETVFNDESFYKYFFSMDIDDSAYYIENYSALFNKTLYSFSFASKGASRFKEFDVYETIMNSISFNEEEEEETEETKPKEYEAVSTKKLYDDYDDYDYEYIKTTIKITSINSSGDTCAYTVYDLDGYDTVKIKITDVEAKRSLKKGDYLTVSGFCTCDDTYTDLIINIECDKASKTEKRLFKSLGSETKPKPISQEYLNALAQAEDYNEYTPMSKKALYDQLISEYGGKFGNDAAQYAIDNINADWKANALSEAKTYYKDMHMSKADVYDQLISEYGGKYTAAEAQYAVDHLDN